MSADQLMKFVFDYSPPLAVGAIIAVFAMGFVMKAMGYSAIGDKSKVVETTEVGATRSGVESVLDQLGDVEKRLAAVEQDLQNRPTKDDQHRLELAFTRLEGTVLQSAATGQATANAISRIEDYMYAAAAKRGQGSTAG